MQQSFKVCMFVFSTLQMIIHRTFAVLEYIYTYSKSYYVFGFKLLYLNMANLMKFIEHIRSYVCT